MPSLSFKVTEAGLSSISVQEHGKLVACGSPDGNLTIVELSESLYNLQKNEKNSVTAIFERETRREKILEARNREIKLKMKLDKTAKIKGEK
ncbi:hypothetical protein, partial [Salmonella sp. s51228]|uniref:hypothetical protein n=1 Tax=Salmonella sp. s51228 TaxID=3159652 RepID=UPI00397F5E18